MLDHSMRKSCGGGCQSFETDGNFTDEFSRSGSPCLGANTVGLEVCVLFAESIGLLVQGSVSLVVEHFFCKLEGFIVDSSPRGRSENMKSKRTSGSCRQTTRRSTSSKPSSPRARAAICKRKWKPSLKLRTAARCCSKLSERTRSNRMRYDES